jgi:hypothetical protein
LRAEFRASAPDAGKIPRVLGMQYVLNGVSMAVGVMEMALYSSYTPPRQVNIGSTEVSVLEKRHVTLDL